MKQIFTLIAITYIVIAQAQNKAGILDKNFGINGKVLTPFMNGYSELNSSATTSNGNIIISGSVTYDNAVGGFLTTKYSADGLLDSSFGDSGYAVVKNVGYGQATAVQPDDKIVIAGYNYTFNSTFITIARLNANGVLDTKFGNNGIITTPAGEDAQDITIQPDGKILITGGTGVAFIMLRYLSDGTPDISFGNNGVVITSFNGSPKDASSIVLQEDGKIITAGGDNQKFMLARYNTNGSLDEKFGSYGEVITKFSTLVNIINDIVVQSDGKIIAAGTVSNGFNYDVMLVRYLSNGVIDSSFGSNGIAIKKLEHNSAALHIALQKDGKIITSGYTLGESVYSHFLVERFNEDGSIDSLFGEDGYTITEMDQGDIATGLIIQDDGKIVLTGSASNDEPEPDKYEVALARYNNDISKKQIIITKIKRWLQHHNGFTWDGNSSISSYTIQRSYDGIHWKAVSSEQRAMSSSSVHYYEDPSLLSGTNYYRLQTTGTNGSTNYSNVIAITNSDIKVSPNPAKNVLQIQGLPSNQNIKISVVDFSGNIKLQAVSNNNSSYNLNIASLKAGNYLLKIEMNDEVVTKKFVKE